MVFFGSKLVVKGEQINSRERPQLNLVLGQDEILARVESLAVLMVISIPHIPFFVAKEVYLEYIQPFKRFGMEI